MAAESPAAAPRTLFYSSMDLWRDAAFGAVGWRFAPDGLDKTGLVFAIEGKSGVSSFRSGALNNDWVDRKVNGGSLGVGWNRIDNTMSITTLAALIIEDHRLFPDDRTSPPRGTRTGVEAAIELWWQPTGQHMVSARLSGSTIGNQWWARLAPGIRIIDSFWLGPELVLSGDTDDVTTRIGGHLTGLKLFNNEWRLSGGHSFSVKRQGTYGTLALWRRW